MPAPRVRLLVPDVALLDAAIDGPAALTRALEGCEVAEGWEVFPDALPATRDSLASDPESARWGTRPFVLEEPSVLVGWGGFKRPPADDIVELGYSVAPALRRRGIATEAVREMLQEAFSESQVRAVIAHTLAEPGPSTKVLEKTSIVYDGEVNDEDDGRLWRWRHKRGAGATTAFASRPAVFDGDGSRGPAGRSPWRQTLRHCRARAQRE